MYMKEPEKCYRYNDAEDADFTKIVDPKHTALLMIDIDPINQFYIGMMRDFMNSG